MSKGLPYQKFCLTNGLTVILYPMSSVRSVYAVLYVRAGAVYEKENERGISHFAEHAAFLGTKKYPSPLAISLGTENLGASLNGETNKFYTQYWIRLPGVNVAEGIELLRQIVFEPILSEKAILGERGVVLSEFNDFWHNPERRFGYEFWRRRFKREDHPYGWRALGVPETIETFNKEQVVGWRGRYYCPANMILAVAGNLGGKQFRKLVENNFTKREKGIKANEPKFDPNDYSDFTLYYQEENRPQIKFEISFPAFGWRQASRRKRATLGLLNRVFGGGTASRLFQRLREKERFVYGVGSDINLHYSWLGNLGIFGSVPIDKLIPSMRAMKEEINLLIKNGVNEREIEIAKNFATASSLMSFDSPENIAYYLGSQEFDGEEIWLPERYVEEGTKVTKKEIDDLAREIFNYQKMNIGLLGKIPPETLKEIKSAF
ncbi:MAG: pitrilysin family protein [bacterium]|nr:pitrilysin family protein [bacterium]